MQSVLKRAAAQRFMWQVTIEIGLWHTIQGLPLKLKTHSSERRERGRKRGIDRQKERESEGLRTCVRKQLQPRNYSEWHMTFPAQFSSCSNPTVNCQINQPWRWLSHPPYFKGTHAQWRGHTFSIWPICATSYIFQGQMPLVTLRRAPCMGGEIKSMDYRLMEQLRWFLGSATDITGLWLDTFYLQGLCFEAISPSYY